ncbi:creatininase family protein [Erysipelothrix urinaevulpis]|uniref:creatininase family protein n=1 Tax=Erysipelothrix urinaevulpis TaxID=2683717 RepID=UPI001357FC20|nr:creatininase family protein [Erysipelothrix urinaevulpis]
MEKKYNCDTVHKHVPLESLTSNDPDVNKLRPGQLLTRLDQASIAYIPLGTVEWHGRHNPLGVDTIKAEALCQSCAKITGGIVMPPIYGAADAHWDAGHGIGIGMDAVAGFMLPGNYYHVETSVLVGYIGSIVKNLLDRGIKMVVLISGHNPPVQDDMMKQIAYQFKHDNGLEPVLAFMEFEALEDGHPLKYGDHAGGYETSYMMHLCPDLVDLSKNDKMLIEDLGVGTEIPVKESNADLGRQHFEIQIETLSKRIINSYEQLTKKDL